MKLFLDANILISVLNQEYPVFNYTSRILSLSDRTPYQMFTSPICLAISFYFSEKKSGSKVAKKKIQVLTSKIGSTCVDHGVVIQAINDKRVIDFEDGLEYYSAIKEGCQLIITENVSDFFYAEIPVMDSRQFIREFF
ncbi:MAG: twitching motility protein PilT [Lunatimonas sp.]|uniref:type II toxin-antitoxin system VapC family toxin n=1 Tax=Lunatimonas sp. TaxID=2060141 RepID=UPI00263B54AF|nr:PIN domain-containing protein [Lunatimonas sp.]MCC5938256.1 twitching motility protein PilT [Lunatimonas sp.]